MWQDFLTLCTAAAALALPQDWWLAWSFAPAVIVPLAALLWAGWAGGVRARKKLTVRNRASVGWQDACFIGGWCVLTIALVSPLCRLAATLVSAHMAQLMLLAIVAPALLVLGGVVERLRSVISLTHQPASPGAGQVGLAAAFYAVVLWGWHVPVAYEATLTSSAAHVAAYTLLLVSAIWFWSEIFRAPMAARSRVIAALAGTLAHTGFLGAILTFTPRILYPVQSAGAAAWQLSALEDQQLAGLIMWVPGGIAYLIVLVALSLKWWAAPDQSIRIGAL